MTSNKRISSSGAAGWMGALALVLVAAPGRAGHAADDVGDVPSADRELTAVASSQQAQHFLPGAVAAATGPQLGAGVGWAGYDGASRTPLVSASVEARLTDRLVLGASAANSSTSAAVRPGVSARLQVLSQSRHGVDGAVALGYRRDLFSNEGGFFQAVLSVGRRVGSATLLANLAYGQDGEGDDRDGELRLAALRPVVVGLYLGADGRVSRALASSDPNAALHGTPSLTYAVGPVVAYRTGPWALLFETGVTGLRTDRLHNGFLTLGGIGAVF